jgi:hypothetical protein
MKKTTTRLGVHSRWFCAVVLALVCAGTAFTQARPAARAPSVKKNAISLDLNYLLRGIIESDSDTDTLYFALAPTFEHLVTSNVSVGGEMHLVFGSTHDVSTLYFGLGFTGRVYPLSEQMEKMFLGVTLGYSILAMDGKIKTEAGGMTSLYTTAMLGYKWHLVENVFFIEPSLAYTYIKAHGFGVLGNLGWTAAIRLGLSF